MVQMRGSGRNEGSNTNEGNGTNEGYWYKWGTVLIMKGSGTNGGQCY